ncbi:MAG: hypothetical protein AB1758_06440 [Candidatus Eremiobacterota bacterium]
MDGLSRRTTSDSPEGVSFLTALLVRFPQIGSATLTQSGRLLALDFYLTRRLRKTELKEFQEVLRDSWEVFFSLQRLHPEEALVRRNEGRRGTFEQGEEGSQEVDSVQVVRDVATLTVEELSLVAALVADRFGRDLAINEDLHEEDDEFQEELIHRSLEQVRSLPQEVDLTGFRDDMRVLIYASEGAD